MQVKLAEWGLRANIIPMGSLALNCLLLFIRLPNRGGAVLRVLIGSLWFPGSTGHRIIPVLSELWGLAASFNAFIFGGDFNARHITLG